MCNSLNQERKKQQCGHRARLREKLLRDNGKGVLDYELLELILCSARSRIDLKPIARRLLEHFGSLSGVFYADIDELKGVKDIGETAATAIICVREAMIRILKGNITECVVVDKWKSLLCYLRARIGNSRVENFLVLYLNKRYGIIADEVHNTGTVDETPVYVREVVRKSLMHSAVHIVVSHNHPSGDPTPSSADIQVTNRLREACSNMNIVLVDHIIVTPRRHYSFKTHGLL
ncbi:MAG: DNA repair protein RadC [Aaplasma endosymbiont of Hyalomma asiaticum]